MTQKTGNENFYFEDVPQAFLLSDFWRWQSSDLLNNTLRGVLAEFIVAKALNIDTEMPRLNWDSYDLLFNGKIRIEVKSSAYLQSWEQNSDSAIRFTIRPTKELATVGSSHLARSRQSDLYIFCLFTERNKEIANPMMLDKWEFYPVLTAVLDDVAPNQKTMGLSSVVEICPQPFDFYSLLDGVNSLAKLVV
ncbi:MAG: hypothetical protein FWG64_02130 [Firmicutes bacterium]|nr:hypothetical protein [Bacillota bacterium]